jgi:orotidine-5'-phosphate decarboxylase
MRCSNRTFCVILIKNREGVLRMSIDVLQSKIRKTKNPVMVCLCPSWERIPAHLRGQSGGLKEAGEAYRMYCFGLLDALAEIVPAVSVESGAFLALGREGAAAMEDVLAYAAKKGYYVLMDAMRADLPGAADDFAAACFGGLKIGEASFTPYSCDGILLNGYLGSDSVKPYLKYCEAGKNVFVIARSSNKSAREVQDLLSGDRVVCQTIADLAMRWNGEKYGKFGFGEVGITVGATNQRVLQVLRERYDRLFFLTPGYGPQGGHASDARYAFDRLGHGAAVMVGRAVTDAWIKQETDGKDYESLARQAAVKVREQLLGYVTII